MPVVGTPEWQTWKERQTGLRTITAWTRDAPPTALTANASPAITVTDASSAASTPPVSRSGSSRGDDSVRAIPIEAWRNATSPTSPPGLPPGLTRGNSSSGSSQRSIVSKGKPGGPTSTRSVSPRATQSSSGTSSGDDVPLATPSAANAEQDPMSPGGPVQGRFVALSMDDFDDELYYDGSEGLQWDDDVRPTAGAALDAMYFPRADSVVVSKSGGSLMVHEEAKDDGADGEDEDEEDLVDSTGGKELVCPEHNVVCKKGICSVMAKILRAEKAEKRRQELEKERAEREAKREKAAKKKNKGKVPLETPSRTSSDSSRSGSVLPAHLRPGAGAPAVRAPPPHLRAGAPPLSLSVGPGITREMPPHLRPANTPPDSVVGGSSTPTPSPRDEDDARSSTSGWGNISEGPWAMPGSKPFNNKSRSKPAPAVAPRPAPAWGKAPSISASSVRRNNDSWSVSARDVDDDDHDDGAASPWTTAKMTAGKQTAKHDLGAWGRAPSISASSVRRNNDSWSVSARSVAGGPDDDADSVVGSDDGNWGQSPSEVGVGKKQSWAEQMDEEDELGDAAAAFDDDVRSVAASTTSGWGNVSAGPW
ncbi:hypothetical protein C8Q70DRAFT_264281 [Cubamyces menziesii]|nr:hypothetical protein C8Q70DRAFT_264281 [Cubamyces menziesii]